MNHSSLFVAFALIAFLQGGATSTQQDTGLRPGSLPRDPEAMRRTLEERLHGAWQLVGVVYRNTPQTNSTFSGYMLVLPDYLSIEMHLVMRSVHPSGQDHPFFQSGVHRWRIGGPGKLETSSLIGTSNVNEAESWTFEVPNVKRTFTMVLNENSLVLERAGESRMTFRRLPRLPYPGRELQSQKELDEEAAAKEEQDKDAAGDEDGASKKDG